MADGATTEEIEEQLNPDLDDVEDFALVDLSEPESKEEVKESDSKDSEEIKEEPKKEEEKESSESKEDTESESKLDLEKKEVKAFTIQTSEKESVEISADAKISIKVDGKMQEFTLQELANDKSGEVAYDKKFSELGTDKKDLQVERSAFNQESDELMSKVTNFVKAVESQDAAKSLEALGTLAGADPIMLREQFLTLMRENSRAYEKLTPEQQKDLDNQYKMKYLEDRDQNREVQVAQSQEHARMTSEVIQFQRKMDIDDATLVSLKDELEAKSTPLSFEALEERHTSNISQDKASKLLVQVDPSLNDNDDYVAEVKDFIQKNPDLSDEDLVDCIKTAIESTQSKDSETKMAKSSSKTLQKKIAKNNPNLTSKTESFKSDDEDDIIDFDDVSHSF